MFHFASEEQAFAAFGWADALAKGHKAIHDKFVADASAVSEVTDGVMDFIKSWLVDHIKGSDMKYKDTLGGKTWDDANSEYPNF